MAMSVHPPADLAEHLSTVLTILGIVFTLLLGVIGFVGTKIWQNIDKLHTRIDQFITLHYECQKALPLTYLTRSEFREQWDRFQAEWNGFLVKRDHDWEKLWESFNGHKHDNPNGRVVR